MEAFPRTCTFARCGGSDKLQQLHAQFHLWRPPKGLAVNGKTNSDQAIPKWSPLTSAGVHQDWVFRSSGGGGGRETRKKWGWPVGKEGEINGSEAGKVV